MSPPVPNSILIGLLPLRSDTSSAHTTTLLTLLSHEQHEELPEDADGKHQAQKPYAHDHGAKVPIGRRTDVEEDHAKERGGHAHDVDSIGFGSDEPLRPQHHCLREEQQADNGREHQGRRVELVVALLVRRTAAVAVKAQNTEVRRRQTARTKGRNEKKMRQEVNDLVLL